MTWHLSHRNPPWRWKAAAETGVAVKEEMKAETVGNVMRVRERGK